MSKKILILLNIIALGSYGQEKWTLYPEKNDSVKKTNRCVTVEEGYPVCSIGNHVSSVLMQHAFDYLDAPVINCSGKDVPMPYAANLEKLALVTTKDVLTAAKAVLYR